MWLQQVPVQFKIFWDDKMYGNWWAHKHVKWFPIQYTLLGVGAPLQRIMWPRWLLVLRNGRKRRGWPGIIKDHVFIPGNKQVRSQFLRKWLARCFKIRSQHTIPVRCSLLSTVDVQKMHPKYIHRSSEWDLAKWLERLTVSAKVVVAQGSIPASFGTTKSDGRQKKLKQYWIKETPPPLRNIF